MESCIRFHGIKPEEKAKFLEKLWYTEGYCTLSIPFIAIDWNHPMVSAKVGLSVLAPPLPAEAADPIAETPLTNKAAPATPAAIYDTAGTWIDLPLLTVDVMQATSSPVSRDLSCSLAAPSRSGILNAIEGI
jgi:hypothetical protein